MKKYQGDILIIELNLKLVNKEGLLVLLFNRARWPWPFLDGIDIL